MRGARVREWKEEGGRRWERAEGEEAEEIGRDTCGGSLWARLAFELKVGSTRQDEQVSGDKGVVKHKLREGEGYEKATDGARLSFLYRIHAAPRTAG